MIPDSEQSIIGAVFLNPGILPMIRSSLKADDFLSPRNKILFETMSGIASRGEVIKPSVVISALQNRMDKIGGQGYIVDILDSVATSAGWEYHIKQIKEDRVRQSLLEISDMINGKFSSSVPTSEILSSLKNRISQIDQADSTGKTTSIMESLGDVVESLSVDGKKTGIMSGFKDIDRITGGWQGGEFIVVAGRPGMGKSVIAKDFAENANRPVLYFSLEMSKAELIKRQLSGLSGVDFEAIRTSTIHEDSWPKIIQASNKLAKVQIRYNDSGSLSIDELCAIAETEKMVHDTSMVVIDYLQLIRSTERASVREREVANISRKLKCLARNLSIPVICLAQLNRDCDNRTPQIPRASDLRESGSLEQDADMVCLLYRPWVYEKGEDPNRAQFIIAKSRSSRTGVIKLSFIGNNQVFRDGGPAESLFP